MTLSFLVVLSIAGIGLLVFSYTALGRASVSAQEGKVIGATAHIVVRNYLDLGYASVLYLGHTIFSFCMRPFKILDQWACSVFEAGRYTSHRIWTVLTFIVFIPVSLYRVILSIVDSISSKIIAVSTTTWNDIVFIASIPALVYAKFFTFISAIGANVVLWKTAVLQKFMLVVSAIGATAVMWKINTNQLLNEVAMSISSMQISIHEFLTPRRLWTLVEFLDNAYIFFLDLGAVFYNL